jgi:hypothetical protein
MNLCLCEHRLSDSWIKLRPICGCLTYGDAGVSADRDGKVPQNKRSYPPFWERAVPILVATIAIIIAGLLVVAVLAAMGLFPG